MVAEDDAQLQDDFLVRLETCVAALEEHDRRRGGLSFA